MFKTIISTVLILTFALLLSGCSQNSQNYTYHLTVTKSAVNGTKFSLDSPEKEKTLNELMEALQAQTELDYKLAENNGGEMIEMLGVINTMGKQWHLYIDNELQNYGQSKNQIIYPHNLIEWHYETNEPI